jgi:hypothetical protein
MFKNINFISVSPLTKDGINFNAGWSVSIQRDSRREYRPVSQASIERLARWVNYHRDQFMAVSDFSFGTFLVTKNPVDR